MINGLSISDISFTNGYFVSEIYFDRPYIAFSKDCKTWFMKEFNELYDSNITTVAINGSVWLLNGTKMVDILKLKDHILLLTASGFNTNDLDIKSPQRPYVTKGSFIYDAPNKDQLIQLDFYPKKIFIRTRSKDGENVYQTIISNTSDLYQNLNDSASNIQNSIELEFRMSESTLNKRTDRSRITMNGFIVNLPVSCICDYYAIS